MKANNTGVLAKTETMEDIYSFYATYQNTTATASNPFYYVSALGNICLGTTTTVGPFLDDAKALFLQSPFGISIYFSYIIVTRFIFFLYLCTRFEEKQSAIGEKSPVIPLMRE